LVIVSPANQAACMCHKYLHTKYKNSSRLIQTSRWGFDYNWKYPIWIISG